MNNLQDTLSWLTQLPVTWRHVPFSGCIYVYLIDCTVLKVNAKTISLEAPLRNGGTMRINVKAENIVLREMSR